MHSPRMNIARVIVFMGLEPLQGATAMPFGESDIYGAQRPMHYRAQSCSKRGLLLDVHHDVQHFDFGSVSFLWMGLQKST